MEEAQQSQKHVEEVGEREGEDEQDFTIIFVCPPVAFPLSFIFPSRSSSNFRSSDTFGPWGVRGAV